MALIKKMTQFVTLAALMLSATTNLRAQVTIGSDIAPNYGSLLDLKENSNVKINAKKGLGLPRVALTDLSKLKPMYTYADAANTPSATQIERHIGLTVYNINKCVTMDGGAGGPYVWDGENWVLLFVRETYAFRTATAAENTGTNTWGTDVIKHAAKPNPAKAGTNIYEEFISADFGTAGRWMTTNLTAWAYDGFTYEGGDPSPLSGPSASPSGTTYNKAYWAYPSNVLINPAGSNEPFMPRDPKNPTTYNANPYLGLLYTWDAATGGKGNTPGTFNNDAPYWMPRMECGFPEWLGSGQAPAGAQKRRQGICPAGWHLPSDYEWGELFREIQLNTSKYSSTPNLGGTPIDPSNPNDPESTIKDDEDNPHIASPMINTCEPFKTPDGVGPTSNILAKGGFNVLLAGTADGDSKAAKYFGQHAYFWTSSDTDTFGDAARAISVTRNLYTVDRGGNNVSRSNSIPVRCKKDN